MSKPKYDMELFISDVRKIFRDNLNSKIDEINLEKQTLTEETEDNFDIENISDDAWFFEHIPRVWNYPKFVVWGVSSINVNESQEDNFVREVTVFIEVVAPDKGEKVNEALVFKLLRYIRSLEEISMENFDKIRSYGKIKIDSLSPTVLNIDGKTLRAAGIAITASISGR